MLRKSMSAGPWTIVQDGDEITLNTETKQLNLHVNEHRVARRFEKWQHASIAL